MTKSEIAIAIEAYEAGYTKACEDFVLTVARANKQALECAVCQVAGEDMQRAKAAYFNERCKKVEKVQAISG